MSNQEQLEEMASIKNVRMQVPIDLYWLIKKYQAQVFLKEGREQNIAETCVELLQHAIRSQGITFENKWTDK